MPLACQQAIKRSGDGNRPSITNKAIELVVAVDVSGSMIQFSPGVILNSLNSFISEQKKSCIPITISILTFAENIKILHNKLDIYKLPEITMADIAPKGTTALYDAINIGLDTFDSSSSCDKILLIITDGYENSSKKGTLLGITHQITESINKGYLIKYLGGGQNAISIGLGLGIPEECCLSFSNDDEGLEEAILSASSSIDRHSQGLNHGFTPLERINSCRQDAPSNLGTTRGQGLVRIPTLCYQKNQ